MTDATRARERPLKMFARDLARLPVAGGVAALVLGFLGHHLPGGDSLAVFRPEIAVMTLMFCAVAWRFGARVTPGTGAVAALLSLGSIVPFLGPGPDVTEPDLILRQHNMLYTNPQRGVLTADLANGPADVVTLQEIGDRNLAALEELSSVYPAYHICRYERGGVAVMARGVGQQIASGCAERTELAWMRIETPSGPVTVASVHLRWPWPLPQFWQVDLVNEEVARLPQPVVLAGDFNIVPWAAAIARIAQAAEGEIARGVAPTYTIGPLWPAFRIDNVIVPAGGLAAVSVTERLGSDHRGLIARIDLP